MTSNNVCQREAHPSNWFSAIGGSKRYDDIWKNCSVYTKARHANGGGSHLQLDDWVWQQREQVPDEEHKVTRDEDGTQRLG